MDYVYPALGPILHEAIQRGVTDIHLEHNDVVYVRDSSGLHNLSFTCSDAVLTDLLSLCNIDNRQWYSMDEGFTFGGVRMRAHLYYANDHLCATIRVLQHEGLGTETHTLDDVLLSICHYHDGMVLISGPTGSGKSFTLASCIDYMNRHFSYHIVTLEDPIEYRFTRVKSLIHQRQMGTHFHTMEEGIRDALRQDPDVIMVGELRDRPTLEAALHAAETGHLVLATMHTQRSVMAINRIISLFPGEQQEEVRNRLSQVLRMIVCQRLARWSSTFAVARDVLVNTRAVANLIRMRKETQIASIQETQPPMQTLEMAVQDLVVTYGERPELQALLEHS